MLPSLLVLCALAQAEADSPAPPPAAAKPAPPVKVHLKTEAPGASLVDRASKRVLCSAPCGQLLERAEGAELQLAAPGVLDSDVFSLAGAADEVTVRWRPATTVTRVFGTGLTILGGAAVVAAIAIGLAAMVGGIRCASSGAGCPSFTWAYSAIPLSVGGYVALGFGMTLMFRFGIERLELEATPQPAP